MLLTLAKPPRPLDFFAEPELMRRAEPVLVSLLGVIGIVGTAEASFKSFMRWQLTSAEAILALPEIAAKSGPAAQAARSGRLGLH